MTRVPCRACYARGCGMSRCVALWALAAPSPCLSGEKGHSIALGTTLSRCRNPGVSNFSHVSWAPSFTPYLILVPEHHDLQPCRRVRCITQLGRLLVVKVTFAERQMCPCQAAQRQGARVRAGRCSTILQQPGLPDIRVPARPGCRHHQHSKGCLSSSQGCHSSCVSTSDESVLGLQ